MWLKWLKASTILIDQLIIYLDLIILLPIKRDKMNINYLNECFQWKMKIEGKKVSGFQMQEKKQIIFTMLITGFKFWLKLNILVFRLNEMIPNWITSFLLCFVFSSLVSINHPKKTQMIHDWLHVTLMTLFKFINWLSLPNSI